MYLPYVPLNGIIFVFCAENWCKNTFLLKDINPA
jgi:hypothetical protein